MFQGRLEEAVASYRRALRLDPALPEALVDLGNALRALNQLDEADASYIKRSTSARTIRIRITIAGC